AGLMLAVGAHRRAVKELGANAARPHACVPRGQGGVAAEGLLLGAPVRGILAARGPGASRGAVLPSGDHVVPALTVTLALARRQSGPRIDAFAALAAVALASLGIHASIDHVLHFPALLIVASAFAGAGMARAAPTRAVFHQERAE